jgi:hypothetical protein
MSLHPSLIQQFYFNRQQVMDFMREYGNDTDPEILQISQKCIGLLRYLNFSPDNATYSPKQDTEIHLVRKMDSIYNAVLEYKAKHKIPVSIKSTEFCEPNSST